MNKELSEKVCSFYDETGHVLREYDSQQKNQIKVKYHFLPDEECDFSPLSMSEKGDWIDLYTAEKVSMYVGDFALISLGISMKLPEGYEAHVVPRSSTFKNWGILQANSIGIIDSTYCGDNDVWKFPAYATRNVEIPVGTRLCQFRIVPTMRSEVGEIEFLPVEHLSDEDRGGFGSTGV